MKVLWSYNNAIESYDWRNIEKVVKFCVPTCLIVAGLATNVLKLSDYKSSYCSIRIVSNKHFNWTIRIAFQTTNQYTYILTHAYILCLCKGYVVYIKELFIIGYNRHSYLKSKLISLNYTLKVTCTAQHAASVPIWAPGKYFHFH